MLAGTATTSWGGCLADAHPAACEITGRGLGPEAVIPVVEPVILNSSVPSGLERQSFHDATGVSQGAGQNSGNDIDLFQFTMAF